MVTDKFGNEWCEVQGASADDLCSAQEELGLEFQADLVEVLQRFAGGWPTKSTYFNSSNDIEVSLGRILRLSGDGGIVERNQVLRAHQDLPPSYVSFALDNGNANVLCQRPDGRIVYWLLDDPGDRERPVADNMQDFLSGLDEDP